MQNQEEPGFLVLRGFGWFRVVRRESVICDLSTTQQRSPKRNAAETASPRDFAHGNGAHAPQDCTNALHQAATKSDYGTALHGRPAAAQPGHLGLGGGDARRAVRALPVPVPAAARAAADVGPARPRRAVLAPRSRRQAGAQRRPARAVGAAVFRLHQVPRHLPRRARQGADGARAARGPRARRAPGLHHDRPRPRHAAAAEDVLCRPRLPSEDPRAHRIARGAPPRAARAPHAPGPAVCDERG